MLVDVVEARAREGHRLWLRFADGIEGEVDLSELVALDGVFEPFRDPAFFEQVSVSEDLGTVVWPNGADLDPDVLYAEVSGKPIDLSRPGSAA